MIRRWQQGDFALLSAAAPGLSARTLRRRFWGPVTVLPAGYLLTTQRRWPQDWDAVVAVRGAVLVGWAEYGRYPGQPDIADLAVCVVDAVQGQGVGTDLVRALLGQARAAGLHHVHADIAPDNEPARRAWLRVTGGSAADLALAG